MKKISKEIKKLFSNRKIKVLLLEDLPPTGYEGEIIQVKPG
jgi:hypothetical protein